MPKQYVVVGVSAAAIGCLTKLRQLDPEAILVAISYETEFPYNKCFLADYLAGTKSQEQLFTKKLSFFDEQRIDLRLGCTVTHIDRSNKRVICHDGSTISYDSLLLAVGGSSRSVPLAQCSYGKGLFPFYTQSDTDAIKAWTERATTRKIVVVGAGLSGLECADALRACGKEIVVVDKASYPLQAYITHKASVHIIAAMEKSGISYVPNVTVCQVKYENDAVSAVMLDNGMCVETSLVVWAIGAQPNLDLARDAGLEIKHNAIQTNTYLQTNDPSIFAAGDCALVVNAITGQPVRSTTWPDALVQGGVAAHGMVGIEKTYAGVAPIVTSAFFGMKFYAAGTLCLQTDGQILESCDAQNYLFIVLDKQRCVKGFNLIGPACAGSLSDVKRSFTTQTPYPLFVS